MKNIVSVFNCPPYSCVYPTPSAYMTDDAWVAIVPNICKGIRAMPVIKDHPDWWFCLTLDGFGSHLDPRAYETFLDHKIYVVQEGGDTSHVNQPYDQAVAKSDKGNIRKYLDLHHANKQLTQWTLITLCIQGLKKVSKSSWIESFKKVNLHPDHRVGIADWIRKIQAHLVSSEKFFKNRTSLYDAMPNLWRNMPVKDRKAVVELIDGFYEEAKNTPFEEGKAWTAWTTDNILVSTWCVALTKS